jgi:hypothetical protein
VGVVGELGQHHLEREGDTEKGGVRKGKGVERSKVERVCEGSEGMEWMARALKKEFVFFSSKKTKRAKILKEYRTRDPSSLRSTCMRVQNSWGFLLRGGCVRLRTILVLGPRCCDETYRDKGG